MAVKVLIQLQQSPKGGVNITFQAQPGEEITQPEIQMANNIVAICNLLSNEHFQESVNPWIQAELVKLHAMEEGFGDKPQAVL